MTLNLNIMIKFAKIANFFYFLYILYNGEIMKYYIVKKDDTIDKILNRFGMTYKTFIELNGINIKNYLKVGSKIKINNEKYDRSFKENIQKIYQESNINLDEEENIICPFCKNIIILPKQ